MLEISPLKFIRRKLSAFREIWLWQKEMMLRQEEIRPWRRRGYLGYTPQFIKENIFMKYGIPNAQWVETGTFLGTTTKFLSQRYPFVYSVEPGKKFYEDALDLFSGKNVKLFNDASENILPILLPELRGDINFWLDGHYSAGDTFKGDKDCPIEEELAALKDNLSQFDKVSVLIDDVRLFPQNNTSSSGYPSINYLVDWARDNGFNWRIEQDIFIMRKFS